MTFKLIYIYIIWIICIKYMDSKSYVMYLKFNYKTLTLFIILIIFLKFMFNPHTSSLEIIIPPTITQYIATKTELWKSMCMGLFFRFYGEQIKSHIFQYFLNFQLCYKYCPCILNFPYIFIKAMFSFLIGFSYGQLVYGHFPNWTKKWSF